MRTKIVTLVSALIFAINIQAQPVKAFDISNGGVAVGITGNFSNFSTSGSEREGNAQNLNTTTETATTSIDKDVDFASVFIEYAVRGDNFLHGIPGFTFGLEIIPGESEIGAKSRTDTASASGVENDTGTYTAKAAVSDHISIYAEPTIYAGKYVGLYVKGGLSHVTIKTQESLSLGESASTYPDEQVWGHMMGVGLRATSPWGVFVKVEYTETDYGNITLQSTSGNKNRVTASPDQDSTRVMLGFMF